MANDFADLIPRIQSCTLCRDRFAATRTAHHPRPVVWLSPEPSIVIIGQAPGARVHEAGKPFLDRSGDRLREWMGIDAATFYDRSRLAVLPMAFCFPGYDAKGSDLPPPPICARTWHDQVDAALAPVPLTLLVGGYAQKRYLTGKMTVTQTVANWQRHAPRVFPLPHPSWRNTAWLRKNPWFESDLLPALRAQVDEVLKT
ncbi:MAG: uracil-DNA glycosylase family protein [Brevirhabdus sp.]